jgi:hypothetical protein
MNRGTSAGGGNEGSEILRLRKELVHARTQITDLQEELEEKTNLYIKAINVSLNECDRLLIGPRLVQREVEQCEGVDQQG